LINQRFALEEYSSEFKFKNTQLEEKS